MIVSVKLCDSRVVPSPPATHIRAYEPVDRLSPSAIKLPAEISALADFPLASGLEDPSFLKETAELEELQRACSLGT